MGVRYSGSTIVFRDIAAPNFTTFLSELTSALTAAGWTSTVVTGGRMFRCVSPVDLLVAKLKVTDAGAPVAHFQQFSDDELQAGFVHDMGYGGSRVYKIWANACQCFLAVPDFGSVQAGTFACGIPALPPGTPTDPSCGAEPVDFTITRQWWNCGNGDQTFNPSENFRWTRFCFQAYSTLINDTLFVSPLTQPRDYFSGELNLLPFTPSNNIDVPVFYPLVKKYAQSDGLRIDCLVAWDWVIRGQMWDAFIISRYDPAASGFDFPIHTESEVDAAGNTVLSQWIAWNYGFDAGVPGGGGTYYATLYLLLNRATPPGCAVGYIY